jgi:CheY-like chemotaxis protein
VKLGSVLVIDDSNLCMQLMSTLLEPYATKIALAASAEDAIAHIQGNPALDLIVCDVVMKGEDGFAVLEHVHQLPEPKPDVLMVTARPTDEGRSRAEGLGATGYISKPTTLRRIMMALDTEPASEQRQAIPRSRCSGTATLMTVDSCAEGSLVWDVYNISAGGALLETKGPLPVGLEIDLMLDLCGERARVRARVARIQDPSWLEIGGVGVEFLNPSEEASTVILKSLNSEPAAGREPAPRPT